MAREELKWQNIDADDLPAAVKNSFDAMVETEAAFKPVNRARRHSPRSFELGRNARRRLVEVAYQGRSLQVC